jgi:translation initiation factor 2B subunit (eIF-2B alpha/beta/delta family)
METQRITESEWLSDDYREYFNGIKKAVKNLFDENKNEDLPHFTPHGEMHCHAVEKIIYQITYSKSKDVLVKLTEKERFCLVASAWLHDLGMLPSIFRVVYPNLTATPSVIREKHHETTAHFLVEYYRRCGVEEEDKELLAEICFYHRGRENLSKCKKEFIVGFSKKKNLIKLRLLASYLRLADSLHVDISRAPDPNYNICLTYSIPPDSKVHWIKSQIVNGIDIDSENHVITVSFKIPHFEGHGDDKPPYEFREKLDSIIRLVMDSLREELTSVLNVLLDYDITYFTEVIENRQPVYMSKRLKNDLNELVLNYDIMEHPSASKLLVMTIETIANIAGFNLETGNEPKRFRSEQEIDFDDIKKTVKEKFLKKLQEDVKRTRPCHKGIDNLIRTFETIQKGSGSLQEYIFKLNKLYRQYQNASKEIEKIARSFFSEHFLRNTETIEGGFAIILFGYSQSVISALCGFRQAIIDQDFPSIADEFDRNYGGKIEEKYSRHFRFYICEGSPKTQVGSGNRLIYHDGSQYALALKKKSFTDIIIVPDIIVGSIIQNLKRETCFLMVGANGFNSNNFMHSAGHSSIFSIVNENNARSEQKIRKILVVSNHKKEQAENHRIEKMVASNKRDTMDELHNIDSCWFWTRDPNEITRQHVWFPRDHMVIKEHFDKKIKLFNPREDKIDIEDLDFIITNIGAYPIKEINPENTNKNKNKFYEEIDKKIQEDQKEIFQ